MEKDQNTNNTMRYASLATQWMVTLSLAVWAGYKLDKKINWRLPLFLILFPLISLALLLWRLINELNKPTK